MRKCGYEKENYAAALTYISVYVCENFHFSTLRDHFAAYHKSRYFQGKFLRFFFFIFILEKTYDES